MQEKKVAEQKEKRKELFSMQNQRLFEEKQKLRQRDNIRANAMQVCPYH